ncbi:MAG: acyl-CoA thioesterase [Bacilli bacterium]
MISKRKIEVTYADTDMMGIVYHANYIVWFELGRSKFLKDAGFSIQECIDRKVVFPIISVNVKYKAPTRYSDDVEVHTKVKKISKVSTTYIHEIYASGILSVVGEVVIACVDSDSFKPVNLEKRYPELYKKYSEELVYE